MVKSVILDLIRLAVFDSVRGELVNEFNLTLGSP